MMIMSWMNLNLQNANSMTMLKLNMFHNFMLIIIINILTIIVIMMKFNLTNKTNNKIHLQNQNLEILWTIVPIFIIITISMLSINLLYYNNEMKINFINIKIISNQWFWTYEYSNFNLNYNSYLLNNNKFNFFMLETDNNFIMPYNYQIMLILSSMDVIHSWSIPSMNIKIDCIPNQINNKIMMINKPTIMYGQCSEICGIYHSFMPIKIESINLINFIKWI